MHDRLTKLVPEAKIGVAHGRMGATELEDVMTAFTDGGYDILLSTNIVEVRSGHPERQHHRHPPGRHVRPGPALSAARAGRTVEDPGLRLPDHPPEQGADPGRQAPAGGHGRPSTTWVPGSRWPATTWTSAGPATCWGEEQSGHVKEVGIELYQELLREAVEAAKSGEGLGGRGERLDAADRHRHAGDDPGGLRAGPVGPDEPVPAHPPPCRTRARSTPSRPNWSTASASCRPRSRTC